MKKNLTLFILFVTLMFIPVLGTTAYAEEACFNTFGVDIDRGNRDPSWQACAGPWSAGNGCSSSYAFHGEWNGCEGTAFTFDTPYAQGKYDVRILYETEGTARPEEFTVVCANEIIPFRVGAYPIGTHWTEPFECTLPADGKIRVELANTGSVHFYKLDALLSGTFIFDPLPDQHLPYFGGTPEFETYQGLNDNLIFLPHFTESTRGDVAFGILAQTNPDIVSCSVDANFYVDCTVAPHATGYSDVTVEGFDGTEYLQQTFRVHVPFPGADELNAQCISHTLPDTMYPGETREVSVTMKNTGTWGWTAYERDRLGTFIPQNDFTFGFPRVNLDANDQVLPGEEVTFTFTLTAPQEIGTYDQSYRMVREHILWHGELCGAPITVEEEEVHLLFEKIGPGEFSRGDIVTYSISVSNIGTDTARDVYVIDWLQTEGFTFVPEQSTPGCILDSLNQVTCDLGNLASGQSAVVDVAWKSPEDLTCYTDVTNQADLYSSNTAPQWAFATSEVACTECNDGFDNDGDGFVDFPHDIGCSDEDDDNEEDAELVITKSGPEWFHAGDKIEYTIIVENVGSEIAEDVVVVDWLQTDGFTFVPEASYSGCSLNSDNQVVCDLGDLAPFEFANFIVAWVSPHDLTCYSDVVNQADLYSGNAAPQWAFFTSEVACAQCNDGLDNDGDGFIDFPEDIGCEDEWDNDEWNPDDTFTFDALPDQHLPFYGGTPEENTYQGVNDNVFFVADFAESTRTEDVTFAIVGQSNPEIVFCSVDAADNIDCVVQELQNGSSDITVRAFDGSETLEQTFTVHVPFPTEGDLDSLCVAHTIPQSMTVGETKTVSVTLKNTGDWGWTAYERDRLGLFIPQDNFAFGIPRVELETHDHVLNGDEITFTFDITAPQDTGDHDLFYRMVREHVTWYGELCGDTVTVEEAPLAELTFEKSGPANFYPGDKVGYTIIVSNVGDVTAENVVVFDWLQTEGFTFDPEHSFEGCTLNADNQAVCDLGDLAPFAFANFEVVWKSPQDLTCYTEVTNQADLYGDNVEDAWAFATSDVLCKQCSDGLDNDGDGFIDFPEDIGCSDEWDDDEWNYIDDLPPQLSIPDFELVEKSGLHENFVDFFPYASDNVDSDDELTFTLIEQTNTHAVSCELDADRFLDCTAQRDISYDEVSFVTIRATDTAGNWVHDTFEILVHALDEEAPYGDVPHLTLYEQSGNNEGLVDLYSVFEDNHDADTELSFDLVFESDTVLVDCSIRAGRYLDCATTLDIEDDQLGYFTIEVTDSSGNSNQDAFTVTVLALDEKDTSPPKGAVPDVSLIEYSGENNDLYDLWTLFSDNVDTSSALTYEIFSQEDSTLVECRVRDNRYFDCFTNTDIGYDIETSAIILQVNDTSRNSVATQFVVSVLPVDDNVPHITLDDKTIEEQSGENRNVVDLWEVSEDDVTYDSDLVFSFIEQTNTELVTCQIRESRYLDCYTVRDLLYDESSFITIQVEDEAGNYVFDTFELTVVARTTDAYVSTVEATTPHLANGEDASSVVVTLLDSFGRPVSGHIVEIATDRNDFRRILAPETDVNGKAYFTIASTLEGVSTVFAYDRTQDVELVATTEITFYDDTVEKIAPVAVIALPIDGSTYFEDELVTFEGSAYDEDGLVRDFIFSSSIDGELYYADCGVQSCAHSSSGTLSVGTHTLTLLVYDNDGLTGEDHVTIVVKEKIIENIVPEVTILLPLEGETYTFEENIVFSGVATDQDGTIENYVWESNIDGVLLASVCGTSVCAPSFSRNDLTVGEHVVTLTVYDDKGASAYDVVTFIIEEELNEAPTASITSPIDRSQYVVGDEIIFTGIGQDDEGIVSFEWTSSIDGVFEVGTGDFSTVLVDDLTPGEHHITFTVVDAEGLTGSDSITVLVRTLEAPLVSITTPAEHDQFRVGDSITFSALASDSDGIITSYTWTSGGDIINAGVCNTASCTLTFTDGNVPLGQHTITLKVTDNNGLTSEDHVTFTVNELTGPVVSIQHPENEDDFRVGSEVYFEAIASDSDGRIVSYTWESDLDGALNNGVCNTASCTLSFTRTDLSLGKHLVTVEVTDDSGLTATANVAFEIKPLTAPLATIFEPEEGDTFTFGDMIDFVGEGYDPDGVITTYTWASSLDGTFASGTCNVQNCSIADTFDDLSLGRHDITLTVVDDDDLMYTDTFTVWIIINPVLAPTVEIVAPEDESIHLINTVISFEAEAFDLDGEIVAYTWQSNIFGVLANGVGIENLSVQLPVGTHEITILVEDNDGQTAQDTVTVHVFESFDVTAQITATPEKGTAPLEVAFGAIAQCAVGEISYRWDFDNGDGITVQSTLPAADVVYNVPGNYTTTLTVLCGDGVFGSTSVTKTIEVLPFIPNVLPPTDRRRNIVEEELSLSTAVIVNQDHVYVGDTVDLFVRFRNSGEVDMDNVRVLMSIPDLGLHRRLGPFDLNRNEIKTGNLFIDIPKDVDPGMYELRIVTYNDLVKRASHRPFEVKIR